MENPKQDPVDSDPRALVVVGTYSESLSAEAVRSCLEMEGIDAAVFDGVIAATVYNNVFGGVKVMVPRCDESRALALLEARENAAVDEATEIQDEIEPGDLHCQVCHSHRVRSRTWWALPAPPLARLATRWFFRTTVSRCRDCGFAVRS